MTIEFKPLGNSCNLACTYCYQFPMREAGNARVSKGYDIKEMIRVAEEEYGGAGNQNEGYTLFGGEALLVPIKDLEQFFEASFDKYGKSSIQTNGSMITEKHIELFKKYNTSIGISIDGPNELNKLRVPLSEKQNVGDLTDKTMENIRKLKQAGVSVGIIITLHKANGTKETLPRLINFIEWLETLDIKSGNIHMMEVDSIEAKLHELSEEEEAYAFLELAKYFFERQEELSYAPFNEMHNMQRSIDGRSCVWSSCDPMNTQAVRGIEGNGQKSNCGMVNKEGIEWTKAEKLGTNQIDLNYMRDLVLYDTPQEYLGCQGCPFFVLCNGYCVGSAVNGDWRNRSSKCNTLKSLFTYYETKVEEEGKVPFSKRRDRTLLENKYITELKKGRRLIASQLEEQKYIQVEAGESYEKFINMD